MTCEFMLDDGAYVLGALSPAERAEFERHLAVCPSCREAVASLAVLPGLLGRLDQASAIALAAGATTSAPPAPPSLLPRVLAAAAQQRRFDRRRTRRRRGLLSAAYVVLALLLVLGVGAVVHMNDVQPASPPLAMSAMRPGQEDWIQLSADIGMQPTDGGTRLVMTCWYGKDSEPSYVISLVVFDKARHLPQSIGTWTADPGAKVTISGVTHLTPDQIDRVELQRADTNMTLLWWTPS